MGQTIYDIILVGLNLHQLMAHLCRVLPVLGRTRQADTRSYFVLLRLQVVELRLVAECPAGIPDEAVLCDDRLLRLVRARD